MTTTAALQAVLAGEHACVYGYGVLGPHTAAEDEPRIRKAYETHRNRRDVLAHEIRTRNAEPVAALPVYAVPFEVSGPASALRLAGLLERRLAALYAELVASTDAAELRELAATALTDTAVLTAQWTGDTPALPGIN